MNRTLLGLVVAFSLTAQAEGLPPSKILSVSPPRDSFAHCIAKAAVDQVISKTDVFKGASLHKLAGATIEGFMPPSYAATLDFFAGKDSANFLFTARLSSADYENLWQLSDDGSPVTSAVQAAAQVLSIGSVIGSFDISPCN
jgi:hypothetical protein